MTTTTKRRWKYGFKRWIVIGFLIAAGVFGVRRSSLVRAAQADHPDRRPCPAKKFGRGRKSSPPSTSVDFTFRGIPFTNTMLSALLADLVLMAIALLVVRPYVRGNNPVPSKLYAGFEMLVDYFWTLVKNSVGVKWAWRVFPIVMTIFLLILVGELDQDASRVRNDRMAQGSGSLRGQGVSGGANHRRFLRTQCQDPAAGVSAAAQETPKYELVPFLRGAATDINFPASMAVFTVACIFVFGVWAQKGAFFEKYFPLRRVISVPVFGVIDFLVGVLEFVLEFVKVISLSLRLFGNIFAGGLILLIIGSLTVVLIPAGLAAFELFVGTIQSYVFAMLALIFIQMAMAGHGGEGESGH